MKSFSNSYKQAGVDVTAGYESVRLMKEHVKKTAIEGLLSSIGGFGGLFELDVKKYKNPVLVSSTDGVGTKLKLAFLMDKHDTIGIDCVAMCVNDIICYGAKPIIFLDYIALSKNIPQKVAEIVKGVADGCCMAGCALTGGETAEMPGFYAQGEYDIAGFCVGVIDKPDIIDCSTIKAGDVLIALASSGVHSNGYSLVRKVFNINEESSKRFIPDLNKSLGDELLIPTKIYVKPVLTLMEKVKIKGISHITGGGFYENIPRILKPGFCAKIYKDKVKVHPIFDIIQKEGDIPQRDMFSTFNMGVGMVIAVNKDNADQAIKILKECGEDAYAIGEIINGGEEIIIE